MKSQKDGGGLFALVAMENPSDVSICINKLNQTLFLGNRISVMKVCFVRVTFRLFLVPAKLYRRNCQSFAVICKILYVCQIFYVL